MYEIVSPRLSNRHKIKNRNQQQEAEKSEHLHNLLLNLSEDVGKSKEKELVSKLLNDATGKNIKINPGNVQNWQKS